MKRLAVAFTGPSNSGKTTLIQKISQHLSATHRVVIVKHDPKDKAKFDTEGKDSNKFFKSGADTVVLSPTRTTYFSHSPSSVESVIEMVGEFDFFLVEGLKTIPLPRIAIFRNRIDESYLDYAQAIAIDKSVDITTYQLPPELDILDLNDTQGVIEWIRNHAKKV